MIRKVKAKKYPSTKSNYLLRNLKNKIMKQAPLIVGVVWSIMAAISFIRNYPDFYTLILLSNFYFGIQIIVNEIRRASKKNPTTLEKD